MAKEIDDWAALKAALSEEVSNPALAQVAQAADNVGAEAALQLGQVEALLTISTMLNSDLNAGRVLRDLLVNICALFRANRAAVFLREKLPTPHDDQHPGEARRQDIGRVLCVASTGLTAQYLETITSFYEKKEFRQLQTLRRPIYIADARQDYRLNGLREVNRREGFQTMLTLPLLYHDTLIGTLILYHDQPHSYTPPETRLLTILANQAALAITNARLYETARIREREAAQLADAGRIFNASLKTREVLNRVVRTVGEMIANTALVYIIQEDGNDAYPVAFYSKAVRDGEVRATSPVKESQPLRLGEGSVGKAMQTDVPFVLQEEAEILRALPFLTREEGATSLLCVPLKTRGRIIGAIVSYQIGYGQAIKRLGDEQLGLAQALADRAAVAIENARLYEAEKREQRVKDEFLSLVSHELNTPLTNIKGFNHLLSKKLEEAISRFGSEQPNRAVEGLRHYTSVIGSQVERLQNLVADLARIPQIETGQLELQLTPLPLLGLVQTEIATIERSLQTPREAKLKHEFELVAPRPNLKANIDGPAFARIVNSLLTNAVKFSPKGGIVRVELAEGASNTVKLSIADEGIGISEQDLPHIFERFYKASGHLSRANGLGLGLYLSRSLAEAMGGQLTAASIEGRGSIFTLR